VSLDRCKNSGFTPIPQLCASSAVSRGLCGGNFYREKKNKNFGVLSRAAHYLDGESVYETTT
jgi:hypothetical protein